MTEADDLRLILEEVREWDIAQHAEHGTFALPENLRALIQRGIDAPRADLLPCPFCAGDAEAKSDADGYWVECADCHARTLDEFSAARVAAHCWNMRTTRKLPQDSK